MMLIGLGLLLLTVDIFLPSGGILLILSAGCFIASIVIGFFYDPTVGALLLGGETALLLLRKNAETHPFDLALIDTRLPGIDGWQLGSQINEDRDINDTHLILLTPAGKGGDEAKMMLLRWFDSYLGKPIRR